MRSLTSLADMLERRRIVTGEPELGSSGRPVSLLGEVIVVDERREQAGRWAGGLMQLPSTKAIIVHHV